MISNIKSDLAYTGIYISEKITLICFSPDILPDILLNINYS